MIMSSHLSCYADAKCRTTDPRLDRHPVSSMHVLRRFQFGPHLLSTGKRDKDYFWDRILFLPQQQETRSNKAKSGYLNFYLPLVDHWSTIPTSNYSLHRLVDCPCILLRCCNHGNSCGTYSERNYNNNNNNNNYYQ
jgi:hypothetical protein